LNLGAQDYVIKPFNALELLARVKTHLELKYKSEQLVKMNQTLEEKVEQRTSELVESNKKLEGANSRLITLDKAKSEFLSIISHELRTPLNGIYGFTDLLESTLRTTEQLEYVNELKIAARKLVRFSDTALLITELRADRYRMQSYPCSLNDIFETTFSEHSKTIENKNIEIVKMNNTDLIVIGDFELLQKCISNIVENAIGYSPQNGKITINAQKIDGNIVCEICDSGKGFSDEAIEKLFGFFSCDKVMHHSEGYGLGLAAVKLIMDAHESKVEIGKCAEGGAMVKLILKA
jgi:two-component system sensor histidine kinase/response regulator